jgi:SAM domain (Sterile alpha motif)
LHNVVAPAREAPPAGAEGAAVKIAIWLRELGLETYEPAFRDNHIDVETLKTLRATDLEELGVTSLAHRKLLLNAIASLRDRRRCTDAFG